MGQLRQRQHLNTVQEYPVQLYPMTQDVMGQRSYNEYLDSMARMIVNLSIGYRIDYKELRKLIDYAEANHSRLNQPKQSAE
jgi:hypothetical protein